MTTRICGAGLGISLSAGIVFYLGYVLSIGGDFMEGRFLTALMLVAAVPVTGCRLERIHLQALEAGGGWSRASKAVGMVRHVINLDTEVAAARRIRITAVSGDGMYSVGHLALK